MRILVFLLLFCITDAYAQASEEAMPIFDDSELQEMGLEMEDIPQIGSPVQVSETVQPIASQPININPNQTLSENLAQNAGPSMPGLSIPGTQGTWVEKINFNTTPNAPKADELPDLTSGDSIEKVVKQTKQAATNQKRSNVAVFDISGIMLRMSVLQAEELLRKRGYKKLNQSMEIPNFIKWRNEEKCRQNGVVGYERLANCVVKLSKKDEQQYIENAKYAKYDTAEEIQIFMTSNFTNNKIYRVIYKSMSANIKGNSQKALYLRNVKVYDFWRKINQKYGEPDNKDDVTWGLGENKPFLKASTGFLVLEDPMLRELDWTRMSREDQKYLNTDLYTF